MRILAIVGAILLGALLILLGAFGARWFALDGESPAPTPEPSALAAPTAQDSGARRLDLDTLRELLAVVDATRRQAIVESPESFAQFVRQETLNQAVLTAAYANGADQNEGIRVLMERAGQRVLVEAYLNHVVRQNLDPGFPSDAQVREAYDKNQDAFRVPQRMHLWQIFIPLGADADEAETKDAWQRADRISADLRAGKADFAALAKQHSQHEASRLNDGYMGLIRVDELLPPIAEAAGALPVDGVSAPVATEGGLHVLRRGPMVEAELLDFEKVRDNIRARMRREAALKVRQAAIEKIVEEYPVAAPQSDLESWRAALTEEVAGGLSPTPGS